MEPASNGRGFLRRLCTARAIDLLRRRIRDRRRTTVPGVEQTAGAEKAPFLVTIETAAGVRLETGPLVTVFRQDGGLLLDTTSKSATTFSNDEAKDRRRERRDLLGQFRQADGSWGEPIAGKQVGTVAARGYRVTKKWIGIEGFEPTFTLQGAMLDDAARKEFLALDMGAKMKFVRQRLAPWFGLGQALDDFEKKNIKVHYLGKGLKAAHDTGGGSSGKASLQISR